MVMTKLLEKKLVKMYRLLIIFFCLFVFPAIKYFDILDYNSLFSDVHCIHMSIACTCQKNTTTQDIGQGSNSIHIKWNAAKQNKFGQSIFNNETAFGELDYIFKCEGNQEKEIVNRVVNKIGEIFRNTATLIFGTKTSIRRKIKPDNKPWYTTSYYEKRKQFNINRKKYNLNKSSENKQLYLQNVVVNTRKR
jgi:hypothetical protein